MTAALEPLDLELDDLPALPAPAPRTHAEMCAWLDRRHTAALRVARNTVHLAETVLARGDAAAADALLLEARTYLAEADRISARRS